MTTSKEEAELLFKQEPLSGGPRSIHLSMNNVHAQSAQRLPSFGCYASRARQRWRRRNAHLKSHQGLCGAARAVKSSDTAGRSFEA
jgi:hypothetical protein